MPRISNMISQHYRYKDTTSHTSGIQLPQIEYNSGRYMSEYRLQPNAYWQREKHRPHNHTGPGPPPGSAYLVVVEYPREMSITKPVLDQNPEKSLGVVS